MRKALLLGGLLAVIGVSAGADGGGGMFMGYQVAEYPFLERYTVRNNTMGLSYFGGYGYGVAGKRTITGGFGFAIVDPDLSTGIAGGFGGLISGIRLIKRPVNLSIVSWTSFGGIGVGDIDADESSGYFALSEEVCLEIGLPIFRWFMPTIYVGYQVAGNLIPGRLFQSFLSYTPVVGLRIQWGDFY